MKKYLKKTTGIIIAAALLCSQAVFGFEGEDIAVQDLPDLQEQEAVLEDTYGGQQEPGTEAEDGFIDLSSLIEDDTAPEEELPPVAVPKAKGVELLP